MKTNHRSKWGVAALAGLLVLGLAAVAWACTVQARIIGLSTPQAPSGTDVEVRGEGVPAGAPVAIFWNDTSAAMLAETTADSAGNFAVTVRIPEVPADVHYLIAVPEGGQAARAPFQVTSSAPSGPTADTSGERSTDLWRGFSPGENGPSVGDRPAAAAAETTPAAGALGLGLLAVGATGLAAGLGVAVLRRRSTATRPS